MQDTSKPQRDLALARKAVFKASDKGRPDSSMPGLQSFSFKGHNVYPAPQLAASPVLDVMCSHLVLTLVGMQGAKFNLRRETNSLMALCGAHVLWSGAALESLRGYLGRRIKDNALWTGHEALSHAEFLERHGVWRGAYEEATLFYYLEEYTKDHAKDLLATLSLTAEYLREWLKARRTLVEQNIEALGKLLDLDSAERALLLVGALARYQRELRSVLIEFKVSNSAEAFETLGKALNVNPRHMAQALRTGSRLERMGLVENLVSEHNITDLTDLLKVSEKLPPVLLREYNSQAELMAEFTKPSVPSLLVPADFDYVKDEVQVLRNLLGNALAQKTQGINVLLYGPPGTGKTELAKVVAQSAGLDLFEVEHSDREGNALDGKDRYRSLQIAQMFLKGNAKAALLFDEVEDVFPPITAEAAQFLARAEHTAAPASGSVSGKAWVNQILESNPIPTVWVTNRIEQIDPAFRRRFAYHLELKSPPPGAREAMVKKTLETELKDLQYDTVSADFLAKLTERKGLTPAQIRTAIKFASLAGNGQSRHATAEAGDLEKLIDQQLNHADAALGTKPAKAGRSTVTQYSLDMLNVETRFEVPKIVASLKSRGHGSLCFYGAPGTGKTALGEHIAQSVGKPLMVKQASDLVSKYVGETEQNMAKMFKEAETEGAVLLLDEADSFLMDRRGAQRNYEVTEVNEMLQQMERFPGIFICTTNLLDRVDQAALRRFAFKIKFKPLTAAQRETMFVVEALAGKADLLTEALKRRLAKLEQLAPGDFAAVKRQIQILDEVFTPEEFVEQLEAEHRIKPEVREQRAMGFV